MYTAYVLTDEARAQLEAKYPPKYEKFIGHHVTVEFGVPADAEPPKEAAIKVLGRLDNEDGLEALVVSVDGETARPDGNTYHITWSLNPESYKPVDSNEMLKNAFRYKMSLPITIETVPEVLN